MVVLLLTVEAGSSARCRLSTHFEAHRNAVRKDPQLELRQCPMQK